MNVTEIHGNIYADGWFDSISWNEREDKILYIAEKKKEKGTSFFAPPPPKKDESKGVEGGGEDVSTLNTENKSLNTTTNNNNNKLGCEFDYEEDWGEKYVGCSLPRIYILSLSCSSERGLEMKTGEVEGIPTGISCGQVQWAPCNKNMVYTAWEEEPSSSSSSYSSRKLGMIYCFNRKCGIYLHAVVDTTFTSSASSSTLVAPVVQMNKNHFLLSKDDAVARCARFFFDFSFIYKNFLVLIF